MPSCKMSVVAVVVLAVVVFVCFQTELSHVDNFYKNYKISNVYLNFWPFSTCYI